MKHSYSTIYLLLIFLVSCSDKETVMLYDTQEDVKVLVVDSSATKITQPFGTDYPTFPSQSIAYDSLNRVSQIGIYDSSMSIDFNYSNDTIVASVKSNMTTATSSDTIYYILNNKNRLKYAVLALQNKTLGNHPSTGNHLDSIAFSYTTEGYLDKLLYYSKNVANGKYIETSSQKYVVENGNFKYVTLGNGNRYKFTYDDNDHNRVSEFCFDMPKMFHQFSNYNPLALTLPATYAYLGKTSKNNVVRIVYEWDVAAQWSSNTFYSQINYSYRYNTNNLLSHIIMNGTYLLSGLHFEGGSTHISYPAPYYK